MRISRWIRAASLLCCLSLAMACQDTEDTEPYPALITEFVDIPTDSEGMGTTIVNDRGTSYPLSRPFTDLQPGSVYRMVCGYELSDRQTATVYRIEKVEVLKPQPASHCDPLKVTSIWRGGDYINLHLTPKTQGGSHIWAYCVEQVVANTTGQTFCLSLYHDQNNDPASYSATVYGSLYLPRLPDIAKGDSIHFRIRTFDGERTWRFAY